MRKSGTRIRLDIGRIHSGGFADICRSERPNVFVRNRKMPVDDLAFSMINRKGLTLKLELRGYLKQRMKLNPEAFIDLYQLHLTATEAHRSQGFSMKRGYQPKHRYAILRGQGKAAGCRRGITSLSGPS